MVLGKKTGKGSVKKMPPKKMTGGAVKFDQNDALGQELVRILKDPDNRCLTPKDIYDSNEVFSNSGLQNGQFCSAVNRIRAKLGQAVDDNEDGVNGARGGSCKILLF